MILIPTALLTIFALFCTAQLRFQERISPIFSLYLFFYGGMVISLELASSFHEITPSSVIIIHLLLCLGVITIWFIRGKPGLWENFKAIQPDWITRSFFKKNPEITFLAFSIAVIYLSGAILIILTPQNNFDSMTYHLSRIGYWLQNQTLFPWESANPRQVVFPPNAEIGILWTILFWGSDQLSGFIQWTGSFVSMMAVYGIARLMGAKRNQSLWAGLIFLTLPEVFLQSIITKNDLLASAFLSSGVYLLIQGWRNSRTHALWVSALAFSLAIGTKSTVVIAVPGIVCLFALLAISHRLDFRKKITHLIISGMISFLLVGSFGYIQNMIVFKNPTNDPRWKTFFLPTRVPRWQILVESLSLYTIQSIDLASLPVPVAQFLQEEKTRVLEPLLFSSIVSKNENWFLWRSSLARVLYSSGRVHEDLIWFGPIFLILLIISLINLIRLAIQKNNGIIWGIVLIILCFTIAISLVLNWTPYQGRYFTLIAPFAAATFFPWFSNSSKWKGFIRWGISILSIGVLAITLIQNESKPLMGKNAIWNLDSSSIRLINNQQFREILENVNHFVPPDGRLGTRLGFNTWDYLLFGHNFDRSIVQHNPFSTDISAGWLEEHQLSHILIEPHQRTFLSLPSELEVVWQDHGWLLLKPCSTSSCIPSEEDAKAIQASSDPDSLVEIAQPLIGKVGILELIPGNWGVEFYEGSGIYWLGESNHQGLRGYFWSDSERDVKLVVNALPGPGITNPLRQLEFILIPLIGYSMNTDSVTRTKFSIDQPETMIIPVHLSLGLNEFRLVCNNIAEIRLQPNGDRRPLLVLIDNILVTE